MFTIHSFILRSLNVFACQGILTVLVMEVKISLKIGLNLEFAKISIQIGKRSKIYHMVNDLDIRFSI